MGNIKTQNKFGLDWALNFSSFDDCGTWLVPSRIILIQISWILKLAHLNVAVQTQNWKADRKYIDPK
jgi:hypothetical protein